MNIKWILKPQDKSFLANAVQVRRIAEREPLYIGHVGVNFLGNTTIVVGKINI